MYKLHILHNINVQGNTTAFDITLQEHLCPLKLQLEGGGVDYVFGLKGAGERDRLGTFP